MKTLLSSFLLLFSLNLLAQEKFMTIFLDKNIQDLSLEPCFQKWSKNLGEKGFFINIHVLSPKDQNIKMYKSLIQHDAPDYLFFMGDLKLPKMKLIQKDKKDRSKNIVVETETLFPLYSLDSFPKLGGVKSQVFFEDSNISIGVLNLIYHRSTKYSHKGIKKRYCEYFEKNLIYKTCEKSNNIKVAQMIDTDFFQLESDLSVLTTDSKKYSSFKDILEVNNLDMGFIAAHANSKKIYYGYGNNEKILTVSTLLKTKITTKFLNLYSCRVFEDNISYSVGKAFIGQHSETLGVLGSTKSGALAYPKIYYNLLKEGYSFGEALLRYVKYYATFYGGSDAYLDNNGYHSGLIFYGDPTLTLHSCK
jgi:hypothetical protein